MSSAARNQHQAIAREDQVDSGQYAALREAWQRGDSGLQPAGEQMEDSARQLTEDGYLRKGKNLYYITEKGHRYLWEDAEKELGPLGRNSNRRFPR